MNPPTLVARQAAAGSPGARRRAGGARGIRLHLFPTTLGTCAVAWGPAGIVRIALPGATDADTRRSVTDHHPDAGTGDPPTAVRRAVTAIQRHLSGGRADLSFVQLDLGGLSPFHRHVYEAARTVPAGTTVTYGELAALAGRPGAGRAVGQALGRNPFPVVVPCHRVLAAGGRIGGFSAPGGVATKERMLAIEKLAVPAAGSSHLATGALPFDAGRAVRHLRAADAELGRVMAAVGPFTLDLRAVPSTFAALTEAIVHQQLSPGAAATIHRRLCALLDAAGNGSAGPEETHRPEETGGGSGIRPERVLALPEEALRSVGLSGAKARAVRDLAQRALAGTIPTVEEAARMDDDAVVDALSAVRGVGRWTAEMFLMFRLGRPDVLPLGDYGLRRGFAVAFGLDGVPGPTELERRAEAWRPYRTVACWYLWRALDVPG